MARKSNQGKRYKTRYNIPDDWRVYLDKISDSPEELVRVMEETNCGNEHMDIHCPHCGYEFPRKHGQYRSRQRYYCQECRRTFNIYTGSPISGTHKPELWAKYIKLMLEGNTLETCSKEVGISIVTAFSWRHKILDFIDNTEIPKDEDDE